MGMVKLVPTRFPIDLDEWFIRGQNNNINTAKEVNKHGTWLEASDAKHDIAVDICCDRTPARCGHIDMLT